MLPVPRPLTIVLTGINGSGKTTQLQSLTDWADGQLGFTSKSIYGPSFTPAAALFQQAVLEGKPHPEAELYGYMVQHIETATELNAFRLKSQTHIILDRGPETALVYNSHANILGHEEREIGQSMYWRAKSLLRPDLTILLDVDLETSRRRSAKQKFSDHIQDRDDRYYEKLIDSYRELSRAEKSWLVVDANQSEQEVFTQIQTALIRDFGFC